MVAARGDFKFHAVGPPFVEGTNYDDGVKRSERCLSLCRKGLATNVMLEYEDVIMKESRPKNKFRLLFGQWTFMKSGHHRHQCVNH